MRNTVLLVLLLAVTHVFSQECDNTLTGIITDLHDGSPLVDANVIVAGSEIYAQTDWMGNSKYPIYVTERIRYRCHTQTV